MGLGWVSSFPSDCVDPLKFHKHIIKSKSEQNETEAYVFPYRFSCTPLKFTNVHGVSTKLNWCWCSWRYQIYCCLKVYFKHVLEFSNYCRLTDFAHKQQYIWSLETYLADVIVLKNNIGLALQSRVDRRMI